MKNSTKTYNIKNIHFALTTIYILIAVISTLFIITNQITTIDDLLIELFSIITLLSTIIPLTKHIEKGFQNINNIYVYNKNNIMTLLLNLLMLLISFMILNAILSLIIISMILLTMYPNIFIPFEMHNNIFMPIAIFLSIIFTLIPIKITKKILKRYYESIDANIQHLNTINK